MVREVSIESHLRKSVKKASGMCVKLNPFGYVGIPDRIVLLPGGVLVFVECKKPRNAKIARLQTWWADRLMKMGFSHRYVFTREDVDVLLKEFSE